MMQYIDVSGKTEEEAIEKALSQLQLDRDEVLPLLAQAKYGHTAFEPAYELFLYDDEGVRYIVYVSSNCRHLRIDSNYFTLSRSRARRLKSWLW